LRLSFPFNVSHFRAEDFRADGLRSYAKYRGLGMSKATNGLLQAHVIRFIPPWEWRSFRSVIFTTWMFR
jgi:hypothetical protein